MSILSTERRALIATHPTPHKVTGKLESAITYSIHHKQTLQFITKKHGLCKAKLENTELERLVQYI